VAKGDAGEEMHDLLGRPLAAGPPLIEECVAPRPQLLGDDGLDGGQDPVGFRFEYPVLFVARALGVVRPTNTLRGRVPDETVNGRIGELRAVACPQALLVQESSNRLLPAVLQEEFVQSAPNWNLLRVRHEFSTCPLVAEGCRSAQWLSELRPDGNRGSNAIGNFLALPLRHRRNNGIEQAASRTRCIDRLLQGNEARVVLAEDIGKFQELASVPRETRKL
jgi:hypothetical protein